MMLLEFINSVNGIPNTGDTPENKGQCTGVIERWLASLSLPHIWGNAKDLLTNADTNVYTVIKKESGTIPSSGDVLVWDSTWGNGNGHTGVVLYASPSSFTCIEQNNPTGSAPHLVTHYNYNGVLGWIHPNSLAVDQQAQVAQANKDRDINWNCITQVVSYMGITPNPDNKDQMVTDAKIKWDEQKALLAYCQNKNNDYERTVTNLTAEIKGVTDQNSSLADLYAKESDKNSQTIQDGTKAVNMMSRLQNYLKPILDHYKLKNIDLSDPQKTVEIILDKTIEEMEKQQIATPAVATEPTVSQARAAVAAAKRPSLLSRITIALQNAKILVK